MRLRRLRPAAISRYNRTGSVRCFVGRRGRMESDHDSEWEELSGEVGVEIEGTPPAPFQDAHRPDPSWLDDRCVSLLSERSSGMFKG